MGTNDGRDYWGWSCAIVAAFFSICCVISAISAVVGSMGAFDGELSWVEQVEDM